MNEKTKQLIDECIMLYYNGYTFTEIGAHYGFTKQRAEQLIRPYKSKYLKSHNENRKAREEAVVFMFKDAWERIYVKEIEKMYKEGLTIVEISKRMKKDVRAIVSALRNYSDIEYPSCKYRTKYPPVDKLKKLYIDDGLTAKEIASNLNLNQKCLEQYIHKYRKSLRKYKKSCL